MSMSLNQNITHRFELLFHPQAEIDIAFARLQELTNESTTYFI